MRFRISGFPPSDEAVLLTLPLACTLAATLLRPTLQSGFRVSAALRPE
jgi:hypothetical protein